MKTQAYLIDPTDASMARYALIAITSSLLDFQGSESDLRAVIAVLEAAGHKERAENLRRHLEQT